MTIQSFRSTLTENLYAQLGLGVAADLFQSYFISPQLSSRGFCAANLVPVSAKNPLNFCAKILSTPYKVAINTFNLNSIQGGNSIAPIVEEVEFRYLLQKILLNKAPEAACKKLFPRAHINFNAMPAKVLRTLLVASAFALVHVNNAECEQGGGVSQFLGGLLYSSIIESGRDLLTTILLHMIWNQLCNFMP